MTPNDQRMAAVYMNAVLERLHRLMKMKPSELPRHITKRDINEQIDDVVSWLDRNAS